MDKGWKQEILETPCGERLNALIEESLHKQGISEHAARNGDVDLKDFLGKAIDMPAWRWSESPMGGWLLTRIVLKEWPYPQRMRFLDFLAEAIAHRLRIGTLEPRQWILHYQPEDICRAALLVLAEMRR